MTATLEEIARVHPLVAPHRDDNMPPGYEHNAQQAKLNFQKAVEIHRQQKRLTEARAVIEKRRIEEALKKERRDETKRNTLKNKIRRNRKGKKKRR